MASNILITSLSGDSIIVDNATVTTDGSGLISILVPATDGVISLSKLPSIAADRTLGATQVHIAPILKVEGVATKYTVTGQVVTFKGAVMGNGIILGTGQIT